MEIRQAAGVMVRTNSRVLTPEMLAAHLLDPKARRYREGADGKRQQWLYRQIGACCLLAHTKVPGWEMLTIDADTLDAAMLEIPEVANLTSVEIQDAFRAGVTGVYGEFYGISPKTLLGFLKSYVASEKKLEAHRIITRRQEKEDREANERLWREIQEQKKKGMFVPSWGPNYNFKEDKQ